MIISVAVRSPQHSPMFGQSALAYRVEVEPAQHLAHFVHGLTVGKAFFSQSGLRCTCCVNATTSYSRIDTSSRSIPLDAFAQLRRQSSIFRAALRTCRNMSIPRRMA